MVMVKIDSNALFVAPMKIQKDQEMTQAYNTLIKRLQRASLTQKTPVGQ